MNDARYIFPLSIITAVLMAFMLGISWVTGVNQQYFEMLHPLTEYEKVLGDGESILRIILTLDFIFIGAYWLLGIYLVLALWNENKRLLLSLSVACISVTAILDVIENNQFLVFIDSIGQGIPILAASVQTQVVYSSVKWQFAYFAFLFFGFAFPARTAVEQTGGFIMKYIQLPLGFLVYTIPASTLLVTAHLARFGMLLLLILLLGVSARNWMKERPVQS
jgi:hypothetical protein